MAGGRVVGLCGGFQMLAASIRDTHGADGRAGQAEGLGLLNVHTDMSGAKTVHPIKDSVCIPGRWWPATAGDQPVAGFTVIGSPATMNSTRWQTSATCRFKEP